MRGAVDAPTFQFCLLLLNVNLTVCGSKRPAVATSGSVEHTLGHALAGGSGSGAPKSRCGHRQPTPCCFPKPAQAKVSSFPDIWSLAPETGMRQAPRVQGLR